MWLRITAAIIAVICGTLAIAGCAVFLFTCDMGLYRHPLESVIKQKQKCALEIYSMQIFEHRNDIKEDNWFLKNTNIEYGVIKAEDIKNKSLDDRTIYWNYHFKDTAPSKDSYVSERMHMDDTAEYHNRLIPSLTGAYTYLSHNDDTESGLLPITQICRNPDDGIFYMTTAYRKYPVKTIGIPVAHAESRISGRSYDGERYPEESVSGLEIQQPMAYFQLNEKTQKYVSVTGFYKDLKTEKYSSWVSISLDLHYTTTNTIHEVNTKNLPPSNKKMTKITMLSENELQYYKGVYEYEENEDITPDYHIGAAHYEKSRQYTNDNTYWIVANVKPMDKWVTKDDLIAKQYYVLKTLYNFRYICPVLTCLLAFLALAAAGICIYSAGYRQVKADDDRVFCGKKHNVLLSFRQKIPLEIYVLAAFGILDIESYLLNSELEILFYGDLSAWLAAPLVVGVLILLLGTILLLCMNIAHRVHGGILERYTIWHHLRKIAVNLMNTVRGNIPLVAKAISIMAVLTVIEFFMILFTARGGLFPLFIWMWLKLAETVLIIIAALQMKQLQTGSREMAEGNLSHKLDTGKMLWEFKKHGENLNKIHEGILVALEERLKSERFKTELITNVSHDIKTPLTSIINYVDLLQKEGLTEEDRDEYLEVLDRQSKRLKKLIEDLIEASKASTGNLSVNLEPCSLEILLTQTAGEFQEKLALANLDLIISGGETPVYIQADSRHLWRVFDNLMNNICKYAQPGTRVYISQEVSEPYVSIIFRNTSREPLNISEEELMERFVRGDSSRNTEGNGLGLSIAQNLTELMGGTLNIKIDGDLFKVTIRFVL